MALSNIFREPKRELIEQAFGFLAIVGLVACDFGVACLLLWLVYGTIFVPAKYFFPAMLFAVVVMCMSYFLLEIVHEVGEGVCNFMARNGHDPRPRNRR